jgi:hypothetical protein
MRLRTICSSLSHHLFLTEGPGGSMRWITEQLIQAWVLAWLSKLQSGYTRLAAASDEA